MKFADFSVTENTAHPYTRWFGVYFKKLLSFKLPTRFLTAKDLKVAKALRSSENTTKVASPRLIRQACFVCILPIANYDAETWWPGRKRISKSNTSVSTRVEEYLSLIHKFKALCARDIIPVYKTTLVSILSCEAGPLPPEIELDSILRRAPPHIHRLDPYHPLRRRTNREISVKRRVHFFST